MSDDRLQRESAFHNERFGHVDDIREKANKYYAISEHAKDYFHAIASQYCSGKRLLEYGCGTGSQTMRWISRGAVVTGIDISSEGIRKADENARAQGISATYHVKNAEETGFADSAFDVIVGTAILHHLDLHKSFAEIARILSTDGHAIFIEPLGHNPLINLYRYFTPAMRTADEHPLMMKDIDLASTYFSNVRTRYYGILTLAAVPFRNTFLFGPIYRALEFIDRTAMTLLPFVRKYAWMVVLDFGAPKKPG